VTTVYRVENENHFGPYTTSVRGMNFHGCDHQPAPHRAGLGWLDDLELSGFKSMEQMLAWFNTREELDCLEHGGMSVVRIEVEERRIRYGDKQIVFREDVPNDNPREKIPWAEVRNQLDSKLVVPTTAKGAVNG
jgi:hypothetical protein